MDQIKRLNSSTIRRANVARVFHAIRLEPGISPSQLALAAQVDVATLSIILNQLEQEGLLLRGTESRSGQSGRPRSTLRINENAATLAGAALEEAEIRIVLATLSGAQLGAMQLPGSRDPKRAAAAIRAGVLALLKQHRAPRKTLSGIGVGIPGLVGLDGKIALAPALAWRDVDFAKLLAAELAIPVYLENDTNAAAIAEHLFGGSRHEANFIYLTGSSGIGGGLYLGGALYRGPKGIAGELGHMKLAQHGRLCACGAEGCLQAYVSGHAILQRLAEAGHAQPDIAAVQAQAAAGHAPTLQLLAQAGAELGFGLANLANLLAPASIILGGSLALLAEYLLPTCLPAFRANTLAAIAEDVAITVSRLNAYAIPMGGVALALHHMFADPIAR